YLVSKFVAGSDLADKIRPAPDPRTRIAPLMRRSQEAFWRDLPDLLTLRSKRRQWVAYGGDERVTFGRTDLEVYQECTWPGSRAIIGLCWASGFERKLCELLETLLQAKYTRNRQALLQQ